jgi:hypothetical protein
MATDSQIAERRRVVRTGERERESVAKTDRHIQRQASIRRGDRTTD